MRTALLVDEKAMVRRILAVMLERLGFAIFAAETGEQALSLCQDSLPDLALIDWTLPDQEGIALVQDLRRLPGGEKIKVIMSTLERSVTQIETALAAGADEYVTKPFGLEILETKLGYLGFDLPAEQGHQALKLRRQISRVGYAGMTVAEEEEAGFAAGEVIFAQGDQPDFAYILLSGRVAASGPDAEGRLLTQTFNAFELFGEMALIESAPRALTARAVTDCRALRLSRQRFQLELSGASPFLRNWIESLSDRAAELPNPHAETN